MRSTFEICGLLNFGKVKEVLDQGGPFMILLAICSVAAVTVIVYKILGLRASLLVPEGLASRVERIDALVRSGEGEKLLAEVEAGDSSLARMTAVALRHRGRARAEVQEAVQVQAKREWVAWNSGMTALDVIVTVAPLLGLLGTASGLVVMFDGLGDDADKSAISRGIAEALYTTIFGLAIAVPAVVVQSWCARKIEKLGVRLEGLLAGVIEVSARSAKSQS